MADEMAAMANTHTGVILLGVDDKSRTILSIPEDRLDLVETWVRDISSDLIEPPLVCIIRKIPVRLEEGSEKIIIRVDVLKSLFVHQSPGEIFPAHRQFQTTIETRPSGTPVSTERSNQADSL